MRRILSVLLLLTASPAIAGTRLVFLDFQGFAWETGFLPPSAPGDTLRIPCIVDNLSDVLGIDLGATEVTGWISGLVSAGAEDLGGGFMAVPFSAGSIEFYSDPSMDHNFGTLPPNPTVPSTFVNGTLCLGGTLENFKLFYDANTGSGAFEARVTFLDGECLASLQALRADGFFFGGVLHPLASGAPVPQGYDLQVDGFLETETMQACEFDCIELVRARLKFRRQPEDHFGPKDGKFRIDGVFTPCPEFGPLDPSLEEIVVRIGSYVQAFPAGSMVLEDDFDDDDREWEFLNPDGVETITELEIELEADGAWEFEIFGRGIPRAQLLGGGLELVVELGIRDMGGTAQATLRQKKKKLVFKRGDERPCGSPGGSKAGDLVAVVPRVELLQASPNPFNARTTIILRAREPGPARLRIYDVRGRMVRALHSGELPAGEHRLVWSGHDEQGRPQASGVYIYRLEAPGLSTSRKMVLAK